jgi:hypothetical protein
VALQRRRLGEILIEAGVLSEQQLSRALAIQKDDGRRLGSILLAYGFVAEPQLVQALSRQLSVPWVSLWHVDVPEDLLRRVPVEIARECCAVPVYVRSDREQGASLYVAMDDPTNEEAIARISAVARMSVKAMVAGPSDIASAIKDFYGPFEEPAGRPDAPTLQMRLTSSEPPPPPPQAPRQPAPPPPPPVEKKKASAPPAGVPEEGPPSREVVTLDESHVVEQGSAEGAQVHAVEEVAASPAPRRKSSGVRDTIDESIDEVELRPAGAGEDSHDSVEVVTLGPSQIVDDAPQFVSAPVSSEEIAAAVEEFEDEVSGIGTDSRDLVEESQSVDLDARTQEPEPEVERAVEVPEAAAPHAKQGGHPNRAARARALALTLLDGTHLEFKGATQRERNRIESVPELVSLLRASASGEPVDKPLPSARWEHYVASLIELLVSKRILDEEEILERLTR